MDETIPEYNSGFKLARIYCEDVEGDNFASNLFNIDCVLYNHNTSGREKPENSNLEVPNFSKMSELKEFLCFLDEDPDDNTYNVKRYVTFATCKNSKGLFIEYAFTYNTPMFLEGFKEAIQNFNMPIIIHTSVDTYMLH